MYMTGHTKPSNISSSSLIDSLASFPASEECNKDADDTLLFNDLTYVCISCSTFILYFFYDVFRDDKMTSSEKRSSVCLSEKQIHTFFQLLFKLPREVEYSIVLLVMCECSRYSTVENNDFFSLDGEFQRVIFIYLEEIYNFCFKLKDDEE